MARLMATGHPSLWAFDDANGDLIVENGTHGPVVWTGYPMPGVQYIGDVLASGMVMGAGEIVWDQGKGQWDFTDPNPS